MNKQEIKKLVNRNNPFILDVGCYDGKDSKELSDALDCDVHCFEPDPLSQDLFKLNHENNRRLHLYPYALTNVDGMIDFHQSNHPQSNSIREPKEHVNIFPGVLFDEVIKVKSMRLDTWCQAIPTIDFIWADVNGGEEDFIRGGLNALSHTRYLYIELSNKELYEGQSYYDPHRASNVITTLLSDFRVVFNYNWGKNFGNVLFKNIKYGLGSN